MPRPAGMVFDSNGNLFITSLSQDNILKVTNLPVSVADEKNFSLEGFTLEQNYPNPFNPTTRISWQSPVNSQQTLKVYDVLGNEVATLVDEFREAGRYEIEFDASKLSSGIYLYQLQAGSYIETKKMILLQ
uniref:T9SS type A sorting domain-containing protein n=1 Tax=Ignavibacterium album TaxID=591197 RepID=A0A7V3E810_9BACT